LGFAEALRVCGGGARPLKGRTPGRPHPIGLGRFEAFTIIGTHTDSSLQESVAGALEWLSGRFTASVMNTEIEVPRCTVAIFDADAEEVAVQWHGTSDELADLLDHLAK